MRRTFVITAIAALILAACGGGDDESASTEATTVRSTPTTMAMGGGGGGEHAEHGAAPDASCSPSGTNVSIVASGTKFDKTCLAAPAGQAFTLSYDNKDPVAHNIVFLESHAATDVMFRG